MLFGIVTFGLPAAEIGAAQVYQLSGGITASAGVVYDRGNTGHFGSGSVNVSVPISLGALDSTIYFDPVNLTVRQVGSFSPGVANVGVFNETHVVSGQNVSGVLTLSQAFTGPSFDTGTAPIVWDPMTQSYRYQNSSYWPTVYNFPVVGSYSLFTGGETFSGNFSYTLSATSSPPPFLFRTFSSSSDQTSLDLGTVPDYPFWVQSGGTFVNVTAANGFQLNLTAGVYDDRLQNINWHGSPATASIVPEPGTALFGVVLLGVAALRRRRR